MTTNIFELVRPNNDWTEEERKVFHHCLATRVGYGRKLTSISTCDEDGLPTISFFEKITGNDLLNICRGRDGFGYLVFGPQRHTSFVKTLQDLQEGYAFLERKHYRPALTSKHKFHQGD